MTNRDFVAWCEDATALIRYGPDRKAVSDELQAHLEDKYDALIAKGIAPEDATAQTLESMGSAKAIAPQLGAIHRPWLGYLYTFSKVLGILSGLVAGFFLSVFLWHQIAHVVMSSNFDSLPRNVDNITYYCKPNLEAEVDGYHLLIQEAAVTSDDRFYFEIQIRWWPWMEEFCALGDFWAVDSLGNYYYPDSIGAYEQPHLTAWGSTATAGIFTGSMAVVYFDTDAQWVEICYDRDGRDVVFHIDLTGGDSP